MIRQKQRTDDKSAYEVALRLLGSREHSTFELRTKLLRRGYSDTDILATVARLKSQDYLSDERFTEAYIRFRLSRGDGPLKIRAQLLKRGIENSLISKFLRNDESFWLTQALAVDRRIRESPPVSEPHRTEQELRSRRARRLKNRGFPARIIATVLEGHSDLNQD